MWDGELRVVKNRGVNGERSGEKHIFCCNILNFIRVRCSYAIALLYCCTAVLTWASSSGVLYSSLGRAPGSQRYVFKTP